MADTFYAGRKKGWFWYEKPKIAAKKESSAKSFFDEIPKHLSNKEWKKLLDEKIEDAKIGLVRYQDAKAAARMLKITKAQGQMAENVSQAYNYTLQLRPDLDTRVGNPTNQTGTEFYENIQTVKENKILHKLTKRYGLVFFFEGGTKLSEFMCEVVSLFGTLHGFYIMPVTINGVPSKIYPNANKDDQVFNHLKAKKKVMASPAIVAYDQEDEKYIPVISGYGSVSDIRSNVFKTT